MKSNNQIFSGQVKVAQKHLFWDFKCISCTELTLNVKKDHLYAAVLLYSNTEEVIVGTKMKVWSLRSREESDKLEVGTEPPEPPGYGAAESSRGGGVGLNRPALTLTHYHPRDRTLDKIKKRPQK